MEPCPFCSYPVTAPRVVDFTSEDIHTHYEQLTCLKCGADGPRTDLLQGTAEELWNTRLSESS